VKIQQKKHHKKSNLTPYPQLRALHIHKTNPEFIIVPTDENLGPAILNKQKYISQILQEHLLTEDYTQLQPNEAHNKMQQTKIL